METTKKLFYDGYNENENIHNTIRTSNNSLEIDYKKNKMVYSIFAHDSKNEESMSEDLCKFFEKMVYQLEIITAY